MVLILITIFVIVVCAIMIISEYDLFDFGIEYILFSILIGIIGFFVWCLLSVMWLSFAKEVENKLEEKQNILSIKDDSSITGSWSLFGGSIEGVDYYYFWIDTENGKIRKKVESEYAYIVEQNIEQPYYEKYTPICQTIDKDKKPCLWKNDYYIFYVPNNTINYDYELK